MNPDHNTPTARAVAACKAAAARFCLSGPAPGG